MFVLIFMVDLASHPFFMIYSNCNTGEEMGMKLTFN